LDSPSNGRQRLRFGLFEADLASGELYKRGRLVHLQEQPFRILTMLLERPGEVVSREEVQKNLWPEGTFVDFDEGLDTALKKLRQALGDSSRTPIFVETIPRRGYRFIAPVQTAERIDSSNPKTSVPQAVHGYEQRTSEADAAQPALARPRLLRNVLVSLVSVAAIIAAAFIILRWLSPARVPRISRVVQLSHSGRLDSWGGIITDRVRIFFLEREGDRWNLMQIPAAGGESQPFPSPFHNTRIFDISPDMSEFLIAPFTQRASGLQFWTLPVVGGAPRRLGNIEGDDAAFSPDGAKIAYVAGNGIYICSRTGTDVKRLASMPEPSWDIAWSPDGKVLRFTQWDQKSGSTSLWDVSADGKNPHPLLSGWNEPPGERGGGWSPDGRFYFFLSTREETFSVWVRREKSDFPFWSRPGPPIRLTSGPTSFEFVVPSHDGRRLFAASGRPRFELVEQDPHSKQFVTRFKGAQIWDARFSPNGSRIALLGSDGNLWQSRPDGTGKVQLTTDFSNLTDARWSPDGTRIVFDAIKQGRPYNIYQVRAEGGAVEELLPENQVHVYPDWSPDGESIAYSDRGNKSAAPPAQQAIYVLDLRTRHAAKLPGSDGLQFPRWSPDGKYLAALSESWEKVLLFDFHTRQWKEIGHGESLTGLNWSSNSEYLYFEDVLAPGEPLYRIRPAQAQPERVTDFASVLATGATRCQFAGFAPDGSVMAIASRGSNDIYELDLDLP
jgi:Tol biopolymer transport system component/DNA-binding winged helix-turn-helix (wHTH) protein